MYRRIIEFDGVLGWLLIDIAKKKIYLLRYWSGFYVIRYIVGNCNRQKYFQFCLYLELHFTVDLLWIFD